MYMSKVIRRIEKKDREISFLTSRESFNKKNPSGTLKEFYDESLEYITWVLELDGEIVGIARFRDESIKHPNIKNVYYISRIGVKEGFEKKGFAKFMYEHITNYLLEKIDFLKSFCIYFFIPEEDLSFWNKYLENLKDFVSISDKKQDKVWGYYYTIKIKSNV